MICANCKTANDDQYVFCVNCGASISPGSPTSEAVPVTVLNPSMARPAQEESVATVFVPGGHRPAFPVQPETYPQAQIERRSPVGKILIAAAAGVVLLGILGAGIFLVFVWQKASAETLPDHLGMFAQSQDKTRVEEIKKIDLTNAIEAKNNLLKDDALPAVDADPTLILYSDGKDVPVSDLHLIQLDSIKDDGSFKQIDFQAAPIENKPEMKRIRIAGGLANGKYAFALLDGFLNEGKHKFWAFQVRNTAKQDNNGSSLHQVTIAIKPTPTPTPAKTPVPSPSAAPAPQGGTVAYCTTNNVVLRSGPSQDAGKVSNLRRGQKVYILRYSENTEIFQGVESSFAYIQTESGQTGWVFAAFLR